MANIKKIMYFSGIYSAVNILNRVISFMLVPILTRALSPFDYGLLSTFSATHSFTWSFVDMGSSSAVSRRFFEVKNDASDFSRYVFNAFLIKLFFVVTLCGILFSLRDFLFKRFNFTSQVIIILICISLFSAVINTLVRLWLAQEKAYKYSIFEFLHSASSTVLSVFLVVAAGLGWMGRVWGIGAIEFIFAVFCMLFLIRNKLLNCKIDFGYIGDILKFGMPEFIYIIGRWAITSSDRFFLNVMVDIPTTGIYSVGYSVASVLDFIAGGVGLAIMPALFNKLKEPSHQSKVRIVQKTYVYFAFLFVLTLLWIVVSPFVLTIIAGKQFEGAVRYIPLVSFAFFFNAVFRVFSLYITYSKKTYYLTYAIIISSLVNLVLNYFLIKRNGAIGAAQSTLISYLVNLLFAWYFAFKAYPMPWFKLSRR